MSSPGDHGAAGYFFRNSPGNSLAASSCPARTALVSWSRASRRSYSSQAIPASAEGEANLGAFTYSRALRLKDLEVGGRVHDETLFLVADSGPLANPENPEDGN